MNPDPYKGLGTTVDPNEEQNTTVDPYEGLGTTVDPYEGLGALETNSNYFVDKAKRLGQSLAPVPGQVVDYVGQMADATGRGLAVVGADELNALRDSPTDVRLAAIGQALRTPTPGTALIRETGRDMTQSARDLYKGNYAPDPARDTELGSKVAGSAGPLAAAVIMPGGLVAKTAMGALFNAGGQSDEARQKMLQRGATEQDADDEGLRQFVLNLPAGALEAVPWQTAIKRFGGGKIADAVAEKYGKTALRRISTAVFGQAATEAGEEVLQNLWGNAAAKLTYDPTRAVTEGTGEAALVGGIMGAGFGGTAQTTAEIAGALDTRQNLAESKKTLLAQQQQLVRGQRPAQMFPVDAEGKVTNELPLPPEMARVATDRGVFHYNPALIDEATLLKLSQAGRENVPLGLGSQSKADVAARVAQGDPAVTVTERTPDGTEVKASVATLGTAGQTAAELEATKTPGNTVKKEPLGQVVAERTAATAPNFIEDMLAGDAAAATAARETAAKEEAARTERQTELADKKARFEERLAVARQTLADPAASFPAVDGALTSLTSYAEDRSIGLTQTQREQALAAQAALQKRHALLAPDAEAAADTRAAAARTEAKLAEDVKTEKVRRERAALQHLETTGRDLATGEITDLTNVPDEELAALDANAEGLTPAQIDAEQQRRGEQAERTAATANEAGYTLRDLILGKKAALAAAGQRSALRLKSPAALSLEGGTMAGEHRALGERQGGFKIFSDTGLAEDSLQERLQSLGFDAPDVTTAYALYERALAGEDIRPERGSGQQVDFAAPTATPGPILTETQVAQEFAALRREFPTLTRDLDLRSGLVADELKRAGYTGPVPPGVQAAILKLQAEKRLLVIAASAARKGKASGLFLHEMAHPFFDALPPETKTILRELHAQEMATATGPLFDAEGQLLTDVKVRAEDFPAARLRADPDLPVKEWFAERVRALNSEWLAGRTPRDHSTMLRVWRELFAKLRAIFAQVRGLDPDSDLFTTTFRRWLDTGAKADLTPAGLAYATRQEAEFASRRNTATANLADPAPRTDFRDAEEQRAYLSNPDNFNDRPYPGVVKGTPLSIEYEALAKKSLELDTERRRQKLSFEEIETIARRATGKRWPDFQDVADYDRTLAELRNPGSQVGKYPGGQTEIAFASRQDTMDLGSTPLGVTLPNEIRNLAPRWQDKTLQFESSLDKALYYAGGTPGALRERIIDDLGQQTGLSAGEIATLARELRQRLAPLARPTASNATVRVPAQMQSAVRQITAVNFATGPATRATVSKPSKKNDYLRVGTSRLGTDAVPLTTPATSNIHGKMVPAELLARQMPYVNYPHLPRDITAEQNPVVKRDKFVAWMKDNLLALYRAFPADVRARATQWYDGANTIATDFSARFNTTLEQASGVLAVLSPQKDWFMNVAQAEQVMDIWKNHQKTVITEQLVREQLEDIISGALATPGSKRKGQPDESPLAKTRRRNANARLDEAAKDERRQLLEPIIGKTLRQLNGDPYLQGWAIRVLAQSIHGREFRIISPEGRAMGLVTTKYGESRKNGWGSINEIEKAVRILRNGNLTNISENLGDEHKVRNFYNNIVAPNTPFGDATMDTHAVAAAHIMPFGSSAVEVEHNFGIGVPGSGPLGVSGIYHLYIDAYTAAAKEIGLMPRQLQSITWEAIRQLYSAESRRDKNVVAAAAKTWKINTNARARTQLLGKGISSPSWARATNDEQPQGKPAKAGRKGDSDDTRRGLRFRGPDRAPGGLDQAGPSVDFATANSASEYVSANGTPPAKVAAARADIEQILGVVQDDQLNFVSYTRAGRLVLGTDSSAAGRPNGRPGTVLGAAEALKAPNQPDVVRAAYGIDPADPSNTGSERISSIIPALIADPKRSWDIRGAQITTARDVMTLVTVLRSPYVETAKIILLNRAGVVVHSEIIGIGSLAAAIVDSNQLAGVLNRAPQTDEGYDVILSHNHPGGNPAPSTGDYTVTRSLRGLLARTKHNLRDHVVTNGDTYYSYAENNWTVPRDPRTGQPAPQWYPMGAPSPVTTQPPAARGADANTRIEPGTAAPWEIVRRNDLYTTNSSTNTRELIASLRQVDPTALHIIYLNRKYLVTALERVPNFKAATPTQAGWRPWEPLTSKLLEGFGREGAAAFMLFAPDTMTSREAKNLMLEMSELGERSGFTLLDYAANQLTVDNTARGLGLMEPGPSVDFATSAVVPAWPANFPNVIVMTTVPNLYAQGGYEAAKAGNAQAARDVVLTTARENKFFDLARRFPDAIIVPVRALERAGNNRLPGEFAAYFGHVTGLRVDDQIVQNNQTGHTGSGSDYRMAHRPSFDGAVIPGQTYIIVDDVVTMGGTLGELRAHLESQGGKVGAITTLAAAQFSAQIALTPKTKLALETKFDQLALREWLQQNDIYSGEFGALTEAEGRWLLAAKTLDAAGDRLAAQRRQGDGRGIAGVLRPSAPAAGPSVDFATGLDPAARLADVEARLAALSNSQEDPADLAPRAKALEAERDQITREIAAEAREAQAAKATIDVRHPAAVAIPSEPGDAWAMAPQMTDGELAAERDSITNHIHDQGDGLAPAMRAHLNARLNALSSEQHRRGTPLGTAVVAIPQIDRQAALVAELTRGRALAAEGNRTGNDAALNEGNRLVRLAKAALDDEFPGWDAKLAPATKAAATQPPLPPEPPTAEAAPASEGDGEQSPFSGAEEETRPVRPGKWDEVYGHSSYTPSFLLKTWRRIRAVLTGIRGPIPELPTFPAAPWNKADTFIAEHGPQFYARIAEGERALKSANDYLQRTASDQIGVIIEPLLKAEGKFAAEDYAQLRASQETARRTQADGKPLPPSLTAKINALNSKMESSPYVLFNRLVFALDLHWRVQNLKDSAGNAIVLPAGINAAETTAELTRLSALLAASPHAALIQTAITAHRALVAQVAQDLKSRELLAADHLANPYYFPHLTLERQGPDNKIEQRELSPARVRPGTDADFRGYLETPVGSKKAIEQDYVRAMYYHLVQVGAHNFKADAVRDYFRPYDIKTTVEARAKELTKERGVPVTWEQAFNEEFAPRGYVKYGTDSRDAFPTLTINRDLLARRLGVMLTSGDLHAQLKALDQTGVKLLPEDIRESLTQGERETWIVPSRVAEALRGIGDRLSAQDNAVEAAAKWTLGVWKGWKLFMPMSHIRYEYGNIVADTEKLLSGSPGTFKYLPIAAKELRAFWLGGKPSADLQAALKDGVLNAITAQELDSLVRIKAFEAFETRSQKAWDIVKRRGSSILYQPATAALGLGDFSTPELSAYREAVTRYAHYQGNLEAIRAGARPAYGGAYWKTIEAMTDSRPGANDAAERKAAAISKATFGDYGDLSVLGQTARDKFIPFYSWMEINFRYHANLLRNLRDMVREGDTPAATQAGKAVALAGASFTARAAGGLALRLALPYLALALWNNSGDRDELEKLLSEEDRRRTHLILGRDGQGKVLVMYGNTALMDVMKWVSGPKFAQAMGGWLNGKTDFTTAAAAWRDAILPDLANNAAGSFGPYFKIPYTLASGKNTFPDITDQRTVPAYDLRRNIIAQITDEFTADLIERTVNKDYYGSKDLGGWAQQLILQVRQRDPESWAFYAIKDKANDYLEKRTGTKRDSSVDAPDQQVLRNFRRAIYRGDVDKAVQFYQRLLDYGYTAERFAATIRSQDPLSALPKENGLRKQFVDSLNPDDRAQLDRAYVFYQRMNASRGQERQLFPSQSSGVNGQMRYQAQPRTDQLRAQMQRVDGMSDEEREQRAQRDEKRSLQRTR
jgi:hypothetical protein